MKPRRALRYPNRRLPRRSRVSLNRRIRPVVQAPPTEQIPVVPPTPDEKTPEPSVAGKSDLSPRQFGSGSPDDNYFTDGTENGKAPDPRYAEFPRQPEPVLSQRTIDELEAEKRSGKDLRIRPAGKLYMQDGDGEGYFYDIPAYRIIGEVFYSYVIIEVGDRVMMIDKHAAHERIIFEQLKQSMKRRVPFVQLLLVPVTLKLTPTELAAVTDYKKDIHSLGFNFKPLPSGDGILIEGVPPDTVPDAAGDMLLSFAEQIISGTGSVSISRELKLERALYQMSCKAAIKAGHDEDISHIR